MQRTTVKASVQNCSTNNQSHTALRIHVPETPSHTSSLLAKPEIPKLTLTDAKSTYHNPQNTTSTAASTCATPTAPSHRSGRVRKLKFVGRRILHKWENDGVEEWYQGLVVGVTSGIDGRPSAVYQIQYDKEDELYDVEDLLQDYHDGNLNFDDL